MVKEEVKCKLNGAGKRKEDGVKNKLGDKNVQTEESDRKNAAAAAGNTKTSIASQSIDDLFTGAQDTVNRVKKKRLEQQATKRAKIARETELREKVRLEMATQNVKPVRFDKELGVNIYKESDLKIGRGGGTKDCPFDCNCCY